MNKKTDKEREEIDKILKEDKSEDIKLSSDRFDEMKAREQFILTVTENGYGKKDIILSI